MPEEVFVSKANGVYKRDYAFRMNVIFEIFEIRSCIEILANDIKDLFHNVHPKRIISFVHAIGLTNKL